MGKSRLCPLLLVLTTACGGAQTSVPPPPPHVPPIAAPAPAPKRGPSTELARMWPFAERPDLVAFVDLAGLRHTAVFGMIANTIGQAMAAGAESSDDRASWACAWAAWNSAREVAVGAGDAGEVFLARFDGPPPTEACASVVGGAPAHVDGASQAFDEGTSGVVALQGDFVAWGDPALIAVAMKGAGASAMLSEMTLEADEYVGARVAVRDPPVSARASLLVADGRLRLAADATLPEALAGQAETAVAQAQTSELVKGNPDLTRLLQDVTVSHTGDHLQAAFELAEPTADQARDLGMLSTLGVYGVRKYIASAKAAEARLMLHQIAGHLVDWASYDAGPSAPGSKRAKLKLFALPPVPSAVPRGVKYQSTPAEWKDWEKIHFALTGAQYYQYEVKVAKDGQSADIVARGDLNGDGKESLFTLKVVVDKGSGKLQVSPDLEERDPGE